MIETDSRHEIKSRKLDKSNGSILEKIRKLPEIHSSHVAEIRNNENKPMIFGTENIPDRVRKRYTMPYQLVTHDIVDHADVCIIGSGAAGSILANIIHNGLLDEELKGKNVVLIEKGGYYDPEDFNQRELSMFKLLWKNGGMQFNDDLSLLIGQGECLGGSTTINDAVCFDTPKLIMKQWKDNGHVDYTKADWKAAIEEVKRNLNIEPVKFEQWVTNKNGRKLKHACESKLPKAYSGTINERNCGDCATCGTCHLGCHYQTKKDMLSTYLFEALESSSNKKFRVYCNCDVEKINYYGDIATGIEGKFLGQNGIEKFKLKINAKVIILAAGSIASSALLMSNNIAIGKAGKGLAVHPSTTVIAKFNEEIRASEGIPMAYSCDEFSIRNHQNNGRNVPEKRFFMLESIFTSPAQFALQLPYELQEKLMKKYQNYAMAGVMVQDSPTGTIELTERGHPKIQYKMGAEEFEALLEGIRELATLYRDHGAEEVIIRHGSPYNRISRENFDEELDRVLNAIQDEYDEGTLTGIGSVHPQGGNMMGKNRDECVVDENCKVYDFNNLFVCDASVFPTAIGVNPQVTVMALATMTAKNILRSWNAQFEGIEIRKEIGEICDRNNPRTCGLDTLSIMFNQARNVGDLQDLVNLDPTNAAGWTLERGLLMINNQFHWRGFVPDPDLTKIIFPFLKGRPAKIVRSLLEDGKEEWALDYLEGFWKRFAFSGNGVTGKLNIYFKPNKKISIIPTKINHEIYGEVIKFSYPQIPHVYDLIKIINKDNIIGKIFLSYAPLYPDLELTSFAMTKNYSVEWMDEDDHQRISTLGTPIPISDKSGYWSLRIVNKHLLTNVIRVLDLEKTSNRYNEDKLIEAILGEFKGILPGWGLSWTNKTSKINENFMVGKITSSQLPANVNDHEEYIKTSAAGIRFYEIKYTLATVAGAWIRDQD